MKMGYIKYDHFGNTVGNALIFILFAVVSTAPFWVGMMILDDA